MSYSLAQYLLYKRQYKQLERPRPRFQLPFVLPVVFYHGQGRWKVPTWEALFSSQPLPEAYKKYIPTSDYVLVDMNQITANEVRQMFGALQEMVAPMLLLKYSHKREALQNSPELKKDIHTFLEQVADEKL